MPIGKCKIKTLFIETHEKEQNTIDKLKPKDKTYESKVIKINDKFYRIFSRNKRL